MQKTSEVYPELYHYTTWNGVKGILESNALWASNIRYLNDSSEYHLAQEFLKQRLKSIVGERIVAQSKTDKEIESYIQAHGGLELQTESLAGDVVRALYKVTGDDFYVASFCGTPLDDYEKENGLLSQWRAYGGETGFCTLFDTRSLEILLEKEAERFYYGPSHTSDVVYHHQEERLSKELERHFNSLGEYVGILLESIVSGSAAPDGKDAMTAFHLITTRIKHRAFQEEREVRIVAAPIKDRRTIDLLRVDKKSRDKAEKPVKFRDWRGLSAPYVELFGSGFETLPIKKIIVGPGRFRNQAAQALKSFLGRRNVDITLSDLPLI